MFFLVSLPLLPHERRALNGHVSNCPCYQVHLLRLTTLLTSFFYIQIVRNGRRRADACPLSHGLAEWQAGDAMETERKRRPALVPEVEHGPRNFSLRRADLSSIPSSLANLFHLPSTPLNPFPSTHHPPSSRTHLPHSSVRLPFIDLHDVGVTDDEANRLARIHSLFPIFDTAAHTHSVAVPERLRGEGRQR